MGRSATGDCFASICLSVKHQQALHWPQRFGSCNHKTAKELLGQTLAAPWQHEAVAKIWQIASSDGARVWKPSTERTPKIGCGIEMYDMVRYLLPTRRLCSLCVALCITKLKLKLRCWRLSCIVEDRSNTVNKDSRSLFFLYFSKLMYKQVLTEMFLLKMYSIHNHITGTSPSTSANIKRSVA